MHLNTTPIWLSLFGKLNKMADIWKTTLSHFSFRIFFSFWCDGSYPIYNKPAMVQEMALCQTGIGRAIYCNDDDSDQWRIHLAPVIYHSKICHHWFRWWLGVCPSHYLIQYTDLLVGKQSVNKDTAIFTEESGFENDVCKIVTILFAPQCIWPSGSPKIICIAYDA